VIGATFIFTSCAIMKGGIETIASRMLDARRTLVVGLAILTGLAVEAFPNYFHSVPATIAPLVGSPLVLGTMVGFVLNAVFRIGTRRRAVLEIDPRAIEFDAIQTFVEGRGGAWGARRDVVARASYAAQQLVEVIADSCQPRGPIALSGSFDQFDLILEARYAGELLTLSDRRPTPEEIIESDDGARLLAGFLLRHNADRSSSVRRSGACMVQFRFHN
jgi:NCS2 family nucleobase:cation symporter-2